MPTAPITGGSEDDTDEDHADHAPYCAGHDDPSLDCSSEPVTTHGITSWLTRTRGTDVAYVASVALSKPDIVDLVTRLQDIHAHMG